MPATPLGATVSGYLEAVASHAQATIKRVRLRIPGPVSMRTQFLAGTIQWDRSCWPRLLPQELRCSLDPGLNHGPSIGPRLALASSCERIRDAIPFLPTESFRPARTIQLDRLCWLRLLPQELRCSLVTGLPSARASLSPRLAKESATPSLSSQLNRSGLAGGLRLTLGVDRDLLFWSRDPVTPLPSLLGTDDTSAARGRCGWKTGIGIQCESKVESIQR